MKLCLFFSPILILLVSPCARSMQMTQSDVVREGASTAAQGAVQGKTGDSADNASEKGGGAVLAYKDQLMHRIEVHEESIQKAEAEHTENIKVARTYAELGLLYADVGKWDRAEADLEHAIAYFRRGPEMNADLATALSGLGRVHIAMGKVRECEKEEVESLKLRERLGDRLLVARSKDDLAEVYLAEQKYAKARGAAQEAIDGFAAEERSDSFDKISARYTLALTMCASKDCPSAVAPLKEAIDEAKTSFQTREFPFGLGEFLLGYAYWKSGDLPDAAVNMKQGTEVINAQLGWTHPISLAAMRHYAHFLRASQRTVEAEEVERRIRQAEAVVDVHSLQGPGDFGIAGLR